MNKSVFDISADLHTDVCTTQLGMNHADNPTVFSSSNASLVGGYWLVHTQTPAEIGLLLVLILDGQAQLPGSSRHRKSGWLKVGRWKDQSTSHPVCIWSMGCHYYYNLL